MFVGLETITSVVVKIAEKVVNDKEPMDRKISMVFQNYAFFLHMTVSWYMGYSLKLAGNLKPKIEQKVLAVAQPIQLSKL